MLPSHAQIAWPDATWQDYPDWEDGDEQVATRPDAAKYGLAPLDLPCGSWPLEIWVDAGVHGEVGRVVFALLAC